MTTQIPDLGEEISFCVDGGSQAGPFSMRQIIESVRSGERRQDVLIWWAGEAEWLPFDANTTLMTLMKELPPLNEIELSEPPIWEESPPADGVEEQGFPEAIVEPESVLSSVSEAPDVFEPTFPVVAEVEPAFAETAPSESDAWVFEGAEGAVEPVPETSTSLGSNEDNSSLSEVFGAIAIASNTYDESGDEHEDLMASEVDQTSPDDDVVAPSALQRSEQHVEAMGIEEPLEPEETASEEGPLLHTEATTSALPPLHNFEMDDLTSHFESLISSSRVRRETTEWKRGVDSAMAAGVVAVLGETGLQFLDAVETETGQTLRFDNPTEGSQVVVELGKVQAVDESGRADLDLEFGWGQHVQDAQDVLASLHGDDDDDDDDGVTGEINFDADDLSSRAFAKIGLVVDAHGYVDQQLQADEESISLTLMAVVEALQNAWLGRFEAATV